MGGGLIKCAVLNSLNSLCKGWVLIVYNGSGGISGVFTLNTKAKSRKGSGSQLRGMYLF